MELADESGRETFVMPVGLFLVIDKDNGGDATAEELVKRFELLDCESCNVIDFYFLGWRRSWEGSGIEFDIHEFAKIRQGLKLAGIKEFGGNADLILVDAVYNRPNVRLRFDEAIRVDLSAGAAGKDFPTLGSFVQSIIDAAEQIKDDSLASEVGLAFSISDRLGIAIAKDSILDFFLEKWGKIIGAKKLRHVAVRKLGPPFDLQDWP
jgi:hypothetical protein